MNYQNVEDVPPRGVSFNVTEEDKIRHEAGHIILHWHIGNKPIAVVYVENGLVTKLEQRPNPKQQPWQYIMALLAGPIAEKHDDISDHNILVELFDILNDIKESVCQYFVIESDSYRICDYLMNFNMLTLTAYATATADILNLCWDLQDNFIERFKVNNRLDQEDIQKMFDDWDKTKK